MRTVKFKSVLHGVAIRFGLQPDVNLTDNQAQAFTEYINDAVQEGWEKDEFHDFTTTEKRFYRDAYDNSKAYVVGNQVYYSTTDKYYECILNSTGNLPTNTTYWEEITEDFDRYVAYEQTGKTKIGEVFQVTQKNPWTNRAPIKVAYALSDNGIQVDFDAPNSVYVKFRKRPPTFNYVAWSSSTSYAVDDIVYLASTGECYISIQAGSNQNPATQTAYWTKIDFPYVLSRFVKLKAYAMALDEDGQTEKAERKRNQAEDALMDEMDKIRVQQKQYDHFEVKTA